MKKKAVLFGGILNVIVILAIVIYMVWGMSKENETIILNGNDTGMYCVSGGIASENGGYTVDSSISGKGLHTCGPYIELGKGIYEITVTYSANEKGNIIYAYDEDAVYYDEALYSDRVQLKPEKSQTGFDIWVNRNLSAFEIQTEYSGAGEFSVYEITITKSRKTVLNFACKVIALLVLTDIIVILVVAIRNKKYSALSLFSGLILVGVSFQASVFLLQRGYVDYKTDLNFILMRIDGLADGLMSGQFPVRIQPNWLNGYGYATSVFYGDLFLILPAFMRICGFTIEQSFDAYIILINSLTCLFSYICIRGIFGKRLYACLGSILYTLSGYRLASLYMFSRGGMVTAYTFIPLVAYGMYLLYYDSKNNKSWVYICIGMTGILNSHLLSAEMTALLLLIIILLSIKRFIRKETILGMVKAVGAAVLINIGFLVPLLDYMGDGFYVSSESWKASWNFIEKSGIEGYGLIPLFKNEQTATSVDFIFVLGVIMCLFLVIVVPQAKLLEENIKFREIGLVTGISSVLFLIMGTHYFPWDFIEENVPFLRMMINSIQYPQRFYSVSSIAMIISLLCGLKISEMFMKKAEIMIISIVVVVFTMFTGSYILTEFEAKGSITRVFDTPSLDDMRISTKEYLPEGANPDEFILERPENTDGVIVSNFLRDGINLSMEVSNISDKYVDVDMPLVAYNGYEAYLNNEKITTSMSDNKTLMVEIPPETAGELKICFDEPWYWTVTFILSIISGVIVIIYCSILWKRGRKENELI